MDTLKSLRDEVLGWIDERGDTNTTAANVDAALNQAHAARCVEEKWTFMLWRKVEAFLLTPSVRDYTLHSEFARPLFFYNRTKREYLEEVPTRTLTDPDIDWIASTSGTAFVLHGVMPVALQPVATSVVTAVSTSAGDTGTIIVRGETLYGIDEDTLTLTGTTPAVGTVSFTSILSLTLSTPGAGRITLTTDGGDTTILVLTAGQLGRNYQQLRLLWVPSSGDTIDYHFYRKPTPLTSDYSIPDIPAPYAKILVWDALLLMAAYDNQVEGNRVELWREKQMALDAALRNAYLDGNSLKSRARYVKYSGD